MRERLQVVGMIGLVLAALLACGKGGKKVTEESKATAAAAAIDVPLATLMADYKNNEVRGDGKYKDKVIRTIGIVNDTKKDFTDSIYVVVGQGKQFEFETVHCQVPKADEAIASALDKGTTVSVTGTVTGLIMGSVMLKDCEIAAAPTKKTAAAATGPVTAEKACAVLVDELGGTCKSEVSPAPGVVVGAYSFTPPDAKGAPAVILQYKDDASMAAGVAKFAGEPEANRCKNVAKHIVVQFGKIGTAAHTAECARVAAL